MPEIIYAKNFLKAVIFRVDFSSEIEEIQKILPKPIIDAVKTGFPILETKETLQTLVHLSKKEQKMEKPVPGTEWHFYSKNRKNKVVIAKNVVFIEVGEYASFGKHKNEFMTAVNAVFNGFEDLQAKRLGLRYMNEITLTEGNPLNWNQWINEKAMYPLDKFKDSSSINRAMHMVEFAYSTFNLRFTFGLDNPDYPAVIKKKQYILDYDAYTSDVLGSDEIVLRLDDFHSSIQSLFESCITTKLRNKMK